MFLVLSYFFIFPCLTACYVSQLYTLFDELLKTHSKKAFAVEVTFEGALEPYYIGSC